MNSLSRALKRALAASVSAAIILLSGGLEAYAAAGRSIHISGAAGNAGASVSAVTIKVAPVVGAGTLPGGNLGVPTLDVTGLSKQLQAGQTLLPMGASAHPGAASEIKLSAAAGLPGAVREGAVAGTYFAAQGKAVAASPAEGTDGAPKGVPTAGESIEKTAASLAAPASGGVAASGRVSKVLRAAASIFTSKKDSNLPTAIVVSGATGSAFKPLAASAKDGGKDEKAAGSADESKLDAGSGVPTPPQKGPEDSEDKNPGKWGGLGSAAAAFIGALLVMQVGVEALSASMPTLVQKAFGDFTVVAQLAIFSSIASIIGRQVGPMFIKKHGLRKVYLVSQVARLLSISVLCALLATGTMTLPLMMGMYSLNGLLGGVSMTAEQSIPTALIGQDQKKIEKFWTIEQTLLEIIGVSAPILTGMVVASMGFLPALIAYPVAFAAALLILFKTLRIPQKVEQMRLADLDKAKSEGKSSSVGGVFKAFFQRIGHGAKLVWGIPALKYSFLAYTAYMALNPFLYSILGPAYALRIVDNPELATSVAGWLTGFYSLGGLLGGLIMIWESKKLDKTKPTPEQETAALRASMLKWMKWGTVGLLGIVTLAFPSPMFLGTLTLPALALIPFGIAQVISFLKLKSYFQSKVPAGEMADAMGFFGAASLAVSTVGLLALKYLFKGLPGFTPFWWIAAAMVPTAILYMWLTRKMAKASEPEQPKNPS